MENTQVTPDERPKKRGGQTREKSHSEEEVLLGEESGGEKVEVDTGELNQEQEIDLDRSGPHTHEESEDLLQ